MKIQNPNKSKTVQLQGIGKVDGKFGSEIEIGDELMWNFGYTSIVKAIAKETKSFITFIITSTHSGEDHERRIKKDRLVAIA